MKNNKLPEGWQEVEFLDCLEKEASNNKLKILQSEFLTKGKYPIIDQGEEFIAGYTDDKSKVYSEKLPVVVFGDHTRILKFVDFPFALGADGVKILVPKNNVDVKYFYYVLRKMKISSAGYSRHYKFLKEIKIPLPSISVQKKIVQILERAESLKQNRAEADKLTKGYLQSVFYEMFGDIIANNKKFPVEKLNNICDVRDGTHDSPDYVSDGYPLITSKNVTNGFIDFSEINLISKEDFDLVNKRSKVDAGDIIMPMIGTIGNPVIIPGNIRKFAIKNVALIKFTKTKVSNIYIYYLLNSNYFSHITSRNNRGGTQKFIALGDIRNIPIPLPPLPLQQKFAKIVERVEKLREKQNQSKEEIDSLFNSLMQRAFKGELVC